MSDINEEQVDDNFEADSSEADQSQLESESQDDGSTSQTAQGADESEPTEESEGASQSQPFHEHPRWKEMVEERNKARQAVEAQQRAYEDLQRKFESLEGKLPKPEPAADPLIERLKDIDPEFASRIESMSKQAQEAEKLKAEVEELRGEFSSRDAQAEAQKVNNQLDQLYKDNNIPETFQDAYRASMLKYAEKNGINDTSKLGEIFKAVHDDYSKAFESIRREERKKYTTEKKQDNSPTNSKAAAPGSGKPGKSEEIPEGVDAREYLKQQIAKRSLSRYRQETDI